MTFLGWKENIVSSRYLDSKSSQGVTTLQASDSATFSVTPCDLGGAKKSQGVARKPTAGAECNVVTPQNSELGQDTQKNGAIELWHLKQQCF